MAKRGLLATIGDRYGRSSGKDKSRILDEFIAVTGHHRKHGIRLLGKPDDDEGTTRPVRGRRIYHEAVGRGGDRDLGSRRPDLREAIEGGRYPTWWRPWSAMAISISPPSACCKLP